MASNNIKALGIHILIMLTGYLLFNFGIDLIIWALPCGFLYILLGYKFLKSCPRFTFLSVISVTVLSLLIMGGIMFLGGDERSYILYYFFSPLGWLATVPILFVFRIEYAALASAVVPSLLMYIGVRNRNTIYEMLQKVKSVFRKKRP